MTLTNVVLLSGATTIGSAAAGATVAVQANSLWNLQNGALTFSNGVGDVFSVDQGAVVTNIGGISMAGAGQTLMVTNDVASRTMSLGSGGGLNVGATVGSGSNFLAIANQAYTSGGASIIGKGSSSNALSILANTWWNGGNANLTVGTNGAGNALLIDGGGVTGGTVVSNVAGIFVGNNANGNSLMVTNGGQLFTSAASGIGGNRPFGGTTSSTNNLAWVMGGAATSVWNAGGAILDIGFVRTSGGGTGNTLRVDGTGVAGSAVLTGVGGINLGYASAASLGVISAGNSLIIANGGYFSGGLICVGIAGGSSSSNNLYRIDGGSAVGGSVVSNGNIIVGNNVNGDSSVMFNTMSVTNAQLWSGSVTNGFGSSNNTILVYGNTLWNLQGGALAIGTSGTTGNVMTINGGSVTNVGAITVVTNNMFRMFGGRVSAGNATVGASLVTLGDGAQAAVWEVMGGTHTFSNGVVVASNATLTGVGTVSGLAGGVTLTNGATIAPGSGVGQLNVSNLVWCGGATYVCQIADVAQAPGMGSDYLKVQGSLGFSNAAANTIIKLDTMGVDAAGFSTNGDYALKIASFGSQSGFNASKMTVDVSSFKPVTEPARWKVLASGTDFYVTYGTAISPAGDYVWTNLNSGTWSDAANWTNGTVPVTGVTSAVKFLSSGSAAYTATDNLGGAGPHVINRLEFDSSSTGPGVVNGTNLQFAGATPALVQYGVGAFIVSNGIDLAGGAGLTFQGAGPGTVALASNITGVGALTKTGPGTLALQGSNSFSGAVLVDGAGGTLRIDNPNALSTNAVTVSNGTVFANIAGYTVGIAAGSRSVVVTGSGAVWTNSAAFTVGQGAAAISNTVTVANGARMSAGLLMVGTNGAARNSLTVDSGARLLTTQSPSIGVGANSNSVSVLNGGFWDLGNTNLYIGNGGATGNTITVTGGTVTNVSGPTIGIFVGASGTTNVGNRITINSGGKVYVTTGQTRVGSSGSSGNALTIDNSVFRSGDALMIGMASGAATGIGGQNSMLVTNGGFAKVAMLYLGNYNTHDYGCTSNTVTVMGSGSSLNLGGGVAEVANAANAYWNTLTVGSGCMVTNGGLTLGGNGSSNNTVTVAANAVWEFGGQPLTFGKGGLNTLTVDPSAVFTNIGGITLANIGQTFALTNDAGSGRNMFLGTGGGLNVGATAGLGTNSLLIDNQVYTSTAVSIIGNGSSNNTLTILSNTLWNAGGKDLTIGNGAATGNVMTVNGGTVTNVGKIFNIANSCSLVVSNGGRLYAAVSPLRVGDKGYSSNSLVVDNGRFYAQSGNIVEVGQCSSGAGGIANRVVVMNGGYLSVVSGLGLGYSATASFGGSDNTLTVSGTNAVGAKSTMVNSSYLQIGNAAGVYPAHRNSATVGSDGVLTSGAITVGGNAGTGCWLRVENGGQVTCSGLTIGATTGTNNNLQVVGDGSYLRVAGTLTVGQTGVGNVFTFNGAGSTATVDRLVATNAGNTLNFSAGVLNVTTSDVNNGTAFLVGNGVQAATLNLLTGSTNRFVDGLVVTNGGILSGVGTIVGNTTIYGANNAGAPMGTLTNVGTFVLAGSALTVVDIGTNRQDYLFVNGDLAVGGTLKGVLNDGLAPTSGATFVVMTNTSMNSIGGSFAQGSARAYSSLNLTAPMSGMFIVTKNDHDVTLRWQAAVPGTSFTIR